MAKRNREKIELWNCPREKKQVTLDKCGKCDYCTAFTDLAEGIHRTCIYEQCFIENTILIDGYAEEEILF
jgi:hypothetical protein